MAQIIHESKKIINSMYALNNLTISLRIHFLKKISQNIKYNHTLFKPYLHSFLFSCQSNHILLILWHLPVLNTQGQKYGLFLDFLFVRATQILKLRLYYGSSHDNYLDNQRHYKSTPNIGT